MRYSLSFVLATALAFGPGATAHAQASGTARYSVVLGGSIPENWRSLDSSAYPKVCRDKMIQADRILAVPHVERVERYYMGASTPSEPQRRTAVWLIRWVGDQRMIILFAWDEGGSLCQVESHDRNSP